MQPFPAAVPLPGAKLRLVLRRFALERAYPGLARRGAVVVVDGGEELFAARRRRRAVVAEKPHPAVAGVELVRLRVVMPLGEIAAVERHLQALLGGEEMRFRAALLGDVAPDAPVAEKSPVGAAPRLSRDDVHLAGAALVGTRDLEIEERQLLLQALEMRLERAPVDFYARNLPEALAEGRGMAKERRHGAAPREPGNAMFGVGLPEPVGRELGEAFQPLLVRTRAGELALAPARSHRHDQVDDASRACRGEQQRVGGHGARPRRRATAARPSALPRWS